MFKNELFKVGETYTTRNGREKIEVICISNNKDYPIIGVNAKGEPETFRANGEFYEEDIVQGQTGLDLIPNIKFVKGNVVKSRVSAKEVLVTSTPCATDRFFEGVIIVVGCVEDEAGTYSDTWIVNLFDKLELCD